MILFQFDVFMKLKRTCPYQNIQGNIVSGCLYIAKRVRFEFGFLFGCFGLFIYCSFLSVGSFFNNRFDLAGLRKFCDRAPGYLHIMPSSTSELIRSKVCSIEWGTFTINASSLPIHMVFCGQVLWTIHFHSSNDYNSRNNDVIVVM